MNTAPEPVATATGLLPPPPSPAPLCPGTGADGGVFALGPVRHGARARRGEPRVQRVLDMTCPKSVSWTQAATTNTFLLLFVWVFFWSFDQQTGGKKNPGAVVLHEKWAGWECIRHQSNPKHILLCDPPPSFESLAQIYDF